jgi:hypothetical protein
MHTAIDPASRQDVGRPAAAIMEPDNSTGRLWLCCASILLLLIMFSATRWILSHPFGFDWDEAVYFNESLTDIQNLHSGSLHKIAGILVADPFRPPAYRLIALPVLSLFGFHPALARFISLALSGLTALFIFLTVRSLGSREAGILAILVFFLSPEILTGSTFYSTRHLYTWPLLPHCISCYAAWSLKRLSVTVGSDLGWQ